MDAGTIQARVKLDEAGQAALGDAYLAGMLSARGRHRVVRVAQTIADLDGRDTVSDADVLLALNFRQRAGGEELVAA
jgi:magnesium chelatase family protein